MFRPPKNLSNQTAISFVPLSGLYASNTHQLEALFASTIKTKPTPLQNSAIGRRRDIGALGGLLRRLSSSRNANRTLPNLDARSRIVDHFRNKYLFKKPVSLSMASISTVSESYVLLNITLAYWLDCVHI